MSESGYNKPACPGFRLSRPSQVGLCGICG